VHDGKIVVEAATVVDVEAIAIESTILEVLT